MIISNVNKRGQEFAGSFTPHADQTRHGSSFAIVEGNGGTGFASVREHISGIARGVDRSIRVPYTEYKDENGNFHEITLGGTTYREMIADRGDLREAEKLEGQQSTDSIQRYQSRNDKPGAPGVTIRRGIEYNEEETAIDTQPPLPKGISYSFPSQNQNRGGRPKGSKNKPRPAPVES